MIDTIMVAVDDSRAAFRAAEVAVELAGRLGASLVAVSVIDGLLAGEPVPGRPVPAVESTRGSEAGRRAGARAAQRHVARLAAAAGVGIELRLTPGHVADSLLDQARLVGAALIVIGRVERPGVRLTRGGHTADQLLEFSEIPVLVVPAS